MQTRYLNVDMVLRSREDLTPIVDFLGEKVLLLWNESSTDEKSIGIESNVVGSLGPQEDLTELLSLLQALPSELSEILGRCSERLVDIGFESGDCGEPINVRVDTNLLQELARLHFDIGIRVYPVPPPPPAG